MRFLALMICLQKNFQPFLLQHQQTLKHHRNKCCFQQHIEQGVMFVDLLLFPEFLHGSAHLYDLRESVQAVLLRFHSLHSFQP